MNGTRCMQSNGILIVIDFREQGKLSHIKNESFAWSFFHQRNSVSQPRSAFSGRTCNFPSPGDLLSSFKFHEHNKEFLKHGSRTFKRIETCKKQESGPSHSRSHRACNELCCFVNWANKLSNKRQERGWCHRNLKKIFVNIKHKAHCKQKRLVRILPKFQLSDVDVSTLC